MERGPSGTGALLIRGVGDRRAGPDALSPGPEETKTGGRATARGGGLRRRNV